MTDETCRACGHAFDPHELIAAELVTVPGIDEPVPVAGPMRCPELGCECSGTWSAPQVRAMAAPADELDRP